MGAQFSSLSAGFASLAGQVLGPLLNSREYQYRVEAEIARTEALLNNYEQTFYRALREVEDALASVRTYREEYEVRKKQVESAKKAAELAWVRYNGGMTSYLEVLDLERSLFGAELNVSETLAKYYTSIIKLYKALGGGWNPDHRFAIMDFTIKYDQEVAQ